MSPVIAELLDELKRYPLAPTPYHRKLGAGSCHTFGLVPRRGLTPEVSAISFLRAKLYKLLVEFGKSQRVGSYTSITIQHNYTLVRRREKTGGKGWVIVIGEYQDSGVKVGTTPVTETITEIDTSSECLVPSAVSNGDRYLILYHSIGHAVDSPLFEIASNGSVNLVSGELSALNQQQNLFWVEMKSGKIEFD